ncbi:ergothioneine biosynthesis protein EgtC [Coleofasciculus sp. FACHB-712]|uniref:ergothioneine biosynthesis protein EgtC n=1 Tax=Coleofasciculus sp. FACHB-712 TaxID=2692789 RepID=UPI0016834C15|nr:ergothioneine biosynthesis protein EgtC [Coleofasciculus sp. FACHB-712]MBD1942394.1 ergothioneine biosynthesis protein EgtC [Coleofasciculus sp. FACHB-712]
MCRILGYLGSPILLDCLLSKPEHSLIVQSYEPREMTSGVVSADGFGIGWYHAQKETDPFIYKNLLPIWGDTNVSNLSRYIESGCVLANVRSATTGQSVDLSNCQPFRSERLLFTHNGAIKNFRKTLYKPIRSRLSDEIYQSVDGTTDSEHMFALFLNELASNPGMSLEKALYKTLMTLTELADAYHTPISANIIVTDGHRMVASRFAQGTNVPSLYWLRDDPIFPEAVAIASEPLFTGNWIGFPEQSMISVGEDLEVQIHQL